MDVCLHSASERELTVIFGLCARGADGGEVTRHPVLRRSFLPNGVSFGGENFAQRSDLLESLDKGALVVGVRMRLEGPPALSQAAFVPENPFRTTMQRLFMDENTADVVFEVEELSGKRHSRKPWHRKKAKASPTHFYAHRLILQQCCTQLLEQCGSGWGGKTSVTIAGVTTDSFHLLLAYLYGVKVPENELVANAKDLIAAADKFRISPLKLLAEACFVNSTQISVENMMEHLVYADKMNCALLKEAVMDFIVENKVELLEKGALKEAPGGLLTNVLAAMARGEKKGASGNSEVSGSDRLSTLRISDLRRKLHEKGLNVDGSREALVAVLKESCSETSSSDS